jgi:hypothetical protein
MDLDQRGPATDQHRRQGPVGELLDLLLVDPARCFTEYLPPMTEIRAELPVC